MVRRVRYSPRFAKLFARLVGARLRSIRQARNLPMTVLAAASGVDTPTICRIERGQMLGTLECHLRLALALGVRLGNLYAGLEEAWMQAAPIRCRPTEAVAQQDGIPALTPLPSADGRSHPA